MAFLLGFLAGMFYMGAVLTFWARHGGMPRARSK